MELVYLWVDRSNNISGQGFNFSSKYKCSLEDTILTICDKTKLECEDNQYINNLFSENLNITAIIGENGSGKSSILDYISNDDNFRASFYVYEEDDKLYFYGDEYGIYEYDEKIILTTSPFSIDKININNTINNEEVLDNFNIKISKVLSTKNDVLKYFDSRFIFDKLIIELKRDNLISVDLLKNNKYEELLINLHTSIFNLIRINVKESKESKNQKNITYFSTDNIELDIKISFLIHYMAILVDIVNSNLIDNKDKEDFFSKNIHYFDKLNLENMFELIKEFEEKSYKLDIHKRGILESIESYEQLIKLFKKFDKDEFYKNNKYSNELSKQFDIEKDLKYIDDIINKCSFCYSEYSKFKCLEFKFYSYNGNVILSDLSTGEQNLINKYFTIIYQILFSSVDTLLIDEPDAFLHPKWSKSFLNNLINIITKDEILKDKKLHLIITTHSPFLLSDLPKENVIFLENGVQSNPFKDKQTFGANIHTLLSDGFFMDGGLMGEFAKGKIEKVIEILNSEKKLSKKKKKYCKNIISIIGEPVLKTTLENMLEQKLYKNASKLQKLKIKQKKLNNEIELLKAKSND